MKPQPLRYRISSWRQLPGCLSNNSRSLHLHVSDYLKDPNFEGFRITVEHDIYGILFACVLTARGYIVSPASHDSIIPDATSYELTTEQILSELRKYGFLIDYNPRENLKSSQLEYLMTLRGLHYDKLRRMAVWHKENDTQVNDVYIVAFKVESHKYWLNNDYSPSIKEFTQALVDGSAINLTQVSDTKKYRWDWLDYVADIDDIIKDNAGDGIYGG